MVVMAFDEKGQAGSLQCAKRWKCAREPTKILTQESGISPEDIIFDPKIS